MALPVPHEFARFRLRDDDVLTIRTTNGEVLPPEMGHEVAGFLVQDCPCNPLIYKRFRQKWGMALSPLSGHHGCRLGELPHLLRVG